MKKITLLIALLITSFVFSQQVVIENFDTTPADYTFAGFEKLGSASIATDPAAAGTRGNNFKMVSSSAGNPWQGAEIILSGSKIRLTTDKTMKVDVYATQAFTMLGKVELGGVTAPISATPASYTTPNQWQTLTFTFNTSSDGTGIANGDYAKIAFFPGRNAANNGWATPANFTVYVDNITGVKAIAAPDPAPTTAATTPPVRNAVDVISLFSNAYTNIPIDSWSAPYDDSSIADVQVAGNDTKKITFSNFLGVQFTGAGKRIDITPMKNLHIDLWTATPTLDKVFNLKLSNWAGGAGEANAIELNVNNASTPKLPNPNPGTWISLDIPLTNLTASRNDIAEFIITAPGLGTVYVDNIYFWRDPLPAGTPTISFTIPAKVIGEASFSLASPIITSDSTGAFTYSSSNTAVASVSGSTVTIVGVGSTTITANQAAVGSFNSSSKTATLDVNPTAAPVPPVSSASVIGLYGETYPVTGYLEGFGGVTAADLDPTAGVDNALKINFANAGYGQGFTTKDVSAMQFVHFDYYTTDAITFRLHLLSGTAPYFEAIYNVPGIQQNKWVSVNIPISNFTGFNPAQFQQFLFNTAAPTPGTVYIDNLYFSLTNPALGTQNFETSKVRMYPNPVKNTLNIEAKGSIERVAVYSILGQEVMSKSPKSNFTTLQTSGLQKGTYIVKSTIDGKTSTSKFIKE